MRAGLAGRRFQNKKEKIVANTNSTNKQDYEANQLGAKTSQTQQQGRMERFQERGGSEQNYSQSHGRWGDDGNRGLTEGQLARGLGWFSLGLGIAEVTAPRRIARLIGVRRGSPALIRVMGLREIASGIGILTQSRPTAGVWSRVGGDAIDLALLGGALASSKSNRSRLAAATTAVIGVAALDVLSAQQLSRSSDVTTDRGAVRVTQSVVINRSPEELYRFWRDFQNLPRFMKHLESVEQTDERRSHWVAKAPAGATVEWDAEIVTDQPNEVIAWRSLEGADVENAGSVRFESLPAGRGTLVKVQLQYFPPAGAIGASLAKLFGEEPEWQIKDDLRRFKQVIEAGEIITTEGQSAGRASGTSWKYDQAARS